ncbi:MAG: hypothetical protein LBD51_01325 [Bifidobacteriaceae bacterium]|nr:hypothetical protein [Bifidobacteriaceae bacterium]
MICLAVDAGGTSTRAVALRRDGLCLGYGRAGSGNPVSAGTALAAASVAASAAGALAAAQVAPDQVECCLVAIAGGVGADQGGAFERALGGIGAAARPVFASDALAAFFSGTRLQDGYALIVGTGTAATRVEAGREAAKADGMGWLLGDAGSGFWIGHQAVRAAVAAIEGRGPATKLADLVFGEIRAGQTGPAALDPGRPPEASAALAALYSGRPVELARFAPLVFGAAGDAVADAILAEAGQALTAALRAVAKPGVSGPVVCGGGVLSHHPQLAQRAAAGLPPGLAGAVRVVPDGVAGAAQLALRATGQDVGEDVFQRLAGSLAAVRRRPA